jgi:hypothetical protein
MPQTPISVSSSIGPNDLASVGNIYKMGSSEKWNEFVFKSGLWDDILVQLKENYKTDFERLMVLDSLTLLVLNISIIFNEKLNLIYTESMLVLLLDLFTNSLPHDLVDRIELQGYLTRIQLNILVIFNFLISNHHINIKDFMKLVGFEQFYTFLIKQLESQTKNLSNLQFENDFIHQALEFISKIPCITKVFEKQTEVVLKLSTHENGSSSLAVRILLKMLVQGGDISVMDQSKIVPLKECVDRSKIVTLYTKKYFEYQLNQDETKVLSVLYALFEKKTFVGELFTVRFVSICKSCANSTPDLERFIDDGIMFISSFAYKAQEKVLLTN